MNRKFENNLIDSKQAELTKAIATYAKQNKHILYGTAGFRDNVALPLQPVFLRVGILAAIRSIHKNAIVGVMITASHNPEQDNGVKMIDHDGGMLAQEWEKHAEDLANAKEEDFLNVLDGVLTTIGLNTLDTKSPVVFIGRDTRPHSEMLSKCVQLGVESIGGIIVDLGEVTTPQLHYIVGVSNNKKLSVTSDNLPDINQLKDLYFNNFAKSYLSLIEDCDNDNSSTNTNNNSSKKYLVVDSSNGVGSITLHEVLKVIKSVNFNGRRDYSNIDIRNEARSGLVNEGCGAEHVQKGVKPPCGVSEKDDVGKLLCSFDGDADRIVFHSYLSPSPAPATAVPWVLMDGDKIAALFVYFLQNEIQYIINNDNEDEISQTMKKIRIGVVQTAYANGSSTKFFTDRNISVSMAKTGVKYLHRVAHDNYDIGVYFEANGHGTILFSDRFLNFINKIAAVDSSVAVTHSSKNRRQVAIQRLYVSI